MSTAGKFVIGIGVAVVIVGGVGWQWYKTRYMATSGSYSAQLEGISSYGGTRDKQALADEVKSYNIAQPTAPRGEIAPATRPAPSEGSGIPSDGRQAAERLVVKTGTMSVVVKDVRVGIRQVTEYAERNGGFVVSSNVTQSGNAPYGTITVRIPSDRFDAGFNEVKSFGEVISEYVQGEDVTAEYIDLESQLKNLQATEEQFLAIMKRAQEIQDVLDVQEKLSNVRGQIEVIQGRMKFLKQSAELSSLTITFSTDPSVLPVVEKQGDQWKPWAEVKEAARNLLDLGKDAVSFAIWVIVFTPVWGLVLIIIFVIRKKVRAKKNESK